MSKILTIQQLKKFKQLTSTLDERNTNIIQQCIDDAEDMDLSQLLGNRLYTYVMSNIEKCEDIISPKVFLDCANMQRSHAGLRKIVANYAYARYLNGDNIRVQPVGVVAQHSDNSNTVMFNEIRRRANEARDLGRSYFTDVNYYIANTLPYSDYLCYTEKKFNITRI